MIVLAPSHVRELANICGDGSFGPLAEVYILLLGIAGGRPGESAGVEITDLDLDSDECQVRFRRTNRRHIDATFLDPDDDAEWGPLKGREIEDSRTAPIPLRDAKRISELLTAKGVSVLCFRGGTETSIVGMCGIRRRSSLVLARATEPMPEP
jgi:hypothetical protein